MNVILFGNMQGIEKIEDTQEPRMTLIASFANESYWGSMANGFTKAGEDLGISTKCIGFTELNIEKQIEAIRSAIYAEVDGIVTAGNEESEEFRQVLKEAQQSGIPVVLVDSDVENIEKLCYVGTDNYKAGKLAGEEIIEATGGSGKVAVVVSNLKVTNQRERLRGFEDMVKEYPEIEIVKVLEGNSDSRILNEQISGMLEEQEDLAAVFCAEGYSTTTICQLIKDAQEEYKDLKVVGFGVGTKQKKNIEEDILYSTIYQNSYEMGYQSLKLLQKSMEHKSIPPVTYTKLKSIKKENIEDMVLDEGKGAQWYIY